MSDVRKFREARQRGASMIEFALLLALILLIGVIGLRSAGAAVNDTLYHTTLQLNAGAIDPAACIEGMPGYPNCS